MMNPPKDKFQDRYEMLVKILLEEFLKAAAVFWKSQVHKVDDKWVSLYDEVIADPARKLEELTRGKAIRFFNIIFASFNNSLIEFALEQMTQAEFRKRTTAAVDLFWKKAMLKYMVDGVDLITAARTIPLKIPTGPVGSKFPYHKIKEMKETYEEVLKERKDINKRSGRNYVARKHEIDCKWPTAPAALKSVSRPTRFALEYTAWKFDIKPDNLRNRLREIKAYPQDLYIRELNRLTKKRG